EALDELAVLGEAPVEDLQRHLAPELKVLRAVDLGHSPAAEAVQHAVAAVDDGLGFEAFGHFRSSCMTALAIGAATVPPNPVPHSTVAAMATRGSCTGAKAMNQSWFGPHGRSTSAVPVLPATSIPCSAAAVPVPSLSTWP